MPVEGRGPRSRRTQQVARTGDWEPSNSETCLCCRWRCTRKRRQKPVIASTRCTTAQLKTSWHMPMPSAAVKGAPGGRAVTLRHRRYGARRWLAEPALALRREVPTGADRRVSAEGQRQTQAAKTRPCGSGLRDSSDAGAGADLRSRPSTGTAYRAGRNAQQAAGGGAAVSAAIRRRGRRPCGPRLFRTPTFSYGGAAVSLIGACCI